jgi:hypothetical protein
MAHAGGIRRSPLSWPTFVITLLVVALTVWIVFSYL